MKTKYQNILKKIFGVHTLNFLNFIQLSITIFNLMTQVSAKEEKKLL